jgi:uncharacterized protein (DUF488 family)
MKSAKTIYTIGHSNVSIETFLTKLTDHKINILVDVRTIPLSRYCPHFSKNALQKILTTQDIQYLWRGRNLGGRGVNVGYDEAVDDLIKSVNEGHMVCIMCSEGDFHKCHRYTMLTPSLEDRGLNIVHIEYEKSIRPKNI